MENYIGFIIILLQLIIQNRYTLFIYKYVANQYPEQWKKLSQHSLDGTPYANLAESFKDGFFATINDTKIARYHTFKTLNLFIIIITSLASLLRAFLI